jgi:hypothetical protein
MTPGFACLSPNFTKTTHDSFPVIWGDLCRCFYKEILEQSGAAEGLLHTCEQLLQETFAQFEPALFGNLPQHSGRSGRLERSHPPPRD